jgi:hypothetical protein
MGECVDEWMGEGWMGCCGWMNEWTDGWMSGRMDGLGYALPFSHFTNE